MTLPQNVLHPTLIHVWIYPEPVPVLLTLILFTWFFLYKFGSLFFETSVTCSIFQQWVLQVYSVFFWTLWLAASFDVPKVLGKREDQWDHALSSGLHCLEKPKNYFVVYLQAAFSSLSSLIHPGESPLLNLSSKHCFAGSSQMSFLDVRRIWDGCESFLGLVRIVYNPVCSQGWMLCLTMVTAEAGKDHSLQGCREQQLHRMLNPSSPAHCCKTPIHHKVLKKVVGKGCLQMTLIA